MIEILTKTQFLFRKIFFLLLLSSKFNGYASLNCKAISLERIKLSSRSWRHIFLLVFILERYAKNFFKLPQSNPNHANFGKSLFRSNELGIIFRSFLVKFYAKKVFYYSILRENLISTQHSHCQSDERKDFFPRKENLS